MDDAICVDDLMDVEPAAPDVERLRRRFADWVRRPRRAAAAGMGTLQRLAELYFAQTALIFPGRRTQGTPAAGVSPTAGGELIRFRTASGDDLAALFGVAASPDGCALSDAATRPTILFFYGNKGHLAHPHVVHLFEGLRRIGVNVMVPEYVGYGLSTGDACEAGCYATADAAYRYLRERDDVDGGRVVVAGASLGGAVAVDLASRERSIAGLITLITFTSMPDMARVIQPRVPIWRFIRHKFESERKMPRVTCPTLVVHSTGDALVPYTMADRLAAACGGPVSRVKIEGAGHNSVEMLEGGGGIIYEAMAAFLRSV